MELTLEQFQAEIAKLATKDDLKPLVTKTDLTDALDAQLGKMVSIINDTIATPMEQHFAETKKQLDMAHKVEQLERDMQEIKNALNLTDKTFAVH